GHAGHDLPGGAVAALKRIVLDEGGLHRMDRFAHLQAFDCRDLLALVHDRECHTGVNAPAADVHCASPTFTAITALLGPAEAEPLAQGVKEGGAGVDGELLHRTINAQRYRYHGRRCCRGSVTRSRSSQRRRHERYSYY